MRRRAAAGVSALQMSRLSGFRISLQEMAMLMAVSCLSPVMTQTCGTAKAVLGREEAVLKRDRCHL